MESKNELSHDKTSKITCAPRKNADQPVHPPSLIRVFAVRMKKHWVLSCPWSALRRLWSDWADAQADLSLRWAHSHFLGFVMRQLRYHPPEFFICSRQSGKFTEQTALKSWSASYVRCLQKRSDVMYCHFFSSWNPILFCFILLFYYWFYRLSWFKNSAWFAYLE